MKLYAETSGRRARQIVFDGLAALWLAGWVWVGVKVHHLVDRLAGPGESLEGAGRSFAGSSGRLGRRADDVPVIGNRLKGAFDTVADGGRALQHAGQAQQDAVHTLALWLGVIVAVLPIVWLLFRYLPGRVGWIREATVASRLRGDLQLFALRAISNQPLVVLARATSDPMAAYRAGDFAALAAVELDQLGLTP